MLSAVSSAKSHYRRSTHAGNLPCLSYSSIRQGTDKRLLLFGVNLGAKMRASFDGTSWLKPEASAAEIFEYFDKIVVYFKDLLVERWDEGDNTPIGICAQCVHISALIFDSRWRSHASFLYILHCRKILNYLHRALQISGSPRVPTEAVFRCFITPRHRNHNTLWHCRFILSLADISSLLQISNSGVWLVSVDRLLHYSVLSVILSVRQFRIVQKIYH